MPPQSKNSNLLTTAIIKKYKFMPYWTTVVLLTQLQKGHFWFIVTFLVLRCTQRQVKLYDVKSVVSRCSALKKYFVYVKIRMCL